MHDSLKHLVKIGWMKFTFAACDLDGSSSAVNEYVSCLDKTRGPAESFEGAVMFYGARVKLFGSRDAYKHEQ